jgi:hypothetical protein
VPAVAEESGVDDGGGGGEGQRRWWQRRPAECGVNSDGGDRESRERWRLRERWGLREFGDKKRNDTGRTTIYRFKNISSGFKTEPLMIVLKSEPKRF